MKKLIFFILFLFILISNTSTVDAHPGKTDNNGCHFCRTNCEKWGLQYGEYHCHNGNSNFSNSSGNSIVSPPKETIVNITGGSSTSNKKENIIPFWEGEYFFIFLVVSAAIELITIFHFNNKINKITSKYERRIKNLENKFIKKRFNEKEIDNIKKEYKKNWRSIYGKNNPYTKKPIFTENDYLEYKLEYNERHKNDDENNLHFF